jgi:hypothetical protein
MRIFFTTVFKKRIGSIYGQSCNCAKKYYKSIVKKAGILWDNRSGC